MNVEEQLTEAIKLTVTVLNDTNNINKRLTNALIAAIVAFCLCLSITVVGIAYFYFTSDYTYPQIQQTQIGSSNSVENVELKGGSE